MKQLNNLAQHLSQEDRDEWVARTNLLFSQMNKEDEIGTLIEAVALSSEITARSLAETTGKIDEKLGKAVEQIAKASKSESNYDREALVQELVDKLTFPDMRELRNYLRRLEEQNKKRETVIEREDKSLVNSQRLLNEFKTLNGKSFVFWTVFVVAIATGAITGILTSYLLHTRVFQ
tara:strand:- start:407 stop:937 length:531 start_codon:yes stop_codon:yes gene_type:complete